MYIYTRADEFSAFALTDSALAGMVTESSAWNKETGLLWLSNLGDNGPYTNLSWYAYNPATSTIVDSMKWIEDGVSDEKPRGLDFSPDGMTAYMGTFANSNERMQKATKSAVSTVNLTLQVDMSVQIDRGDFNAATDVVRCAGDFQGWAPTEAPDMDDSDGDLIYTVTYPVDPNTTYGYKYLIGTDWGNDESVDRSVDVGSSDLTLEPVFYNNDEGGELTEIALTFTCDMEFEVVAERFVPGSDTLSSRGSHNGWTADTELFPTVSDPNVYEGVQMYETSAGETIYYKYAYTSLNGTVWEGNPETGSGNYEYIVTADDIAAGVAVLPSRRFNNATLETVLNQDGTIRFIVDMNNAVDMNGLAFPSIDDVFIAGAVTPLAWPQGGWPDEDVDLVHFLVDDGTGGDETSGDNFWTVELVFGIYSPLRIQYKYGANWGLASNNGANDNESGVGTDHFINVFPSFEYGDAVDVFGAMGDQDIVNGIREIGSEIPNKYDLNQNYPNPFNPTTIISFSIPESGLVTLKVFNLLGQEVATLVNEVKSAGTYEVDFDASQLTTGMYVYTISSGNYSATKKMMLVK